MSSSPSLVCPHCGLLSPAESARCECGYDFALQRLERPYARPAPPGLSTRRSLSALCNAALAVGLSLLCIMAFVRAGAFYEVNRFALALQSFLPCLVVFLASFAVSLRLHSLKHRLVAAALLGALYPLWLLLTL